MASVVSSYGGNIAVEWGTLDVTGVAFAGFGNEYGTVNGVPCGDLVEIGTFTNPPAVGSSSLSNFSVFGSGHIGDGYGCPGSDGFWEDGSVASDAGFAHAQIYVVVVNTTTVAAASQVGIFYVNDAFNPNWRFPASTDVVTTTVIDLEDLLNDPGTPSASLTSGAQIVYGSGPVYDAVDAYSFFQLQQTNSATQVTTNSWSSPTNGKWETATNWSSNNAPTVGDTVDLITNANTKTVTIDATTVLSNAINACLTINNLMVSAPLGSTNTLFLNNAGTATPLQVIGTVLALDTNAAMVVNDAVVVATNGPAQLYVGNTGGNASLIITNGGAVYSGYGNVGNESPSSNNAVLVAGPGSVWSDRDGLSVGESGAGNSLVISNGGAAYALFGVLGYYSSNNTVVVTGTNSVWSNSSTLTVGQTGPADRMIIGNGGAVYDSFSYVGYESPSSNNVVLVTGTNSVWSSGSGLYVGVDDGGGDQMIIGNGGAVYDTEAYVGNSGSGGDNVVLVTGPGSIWSNDGTMSVGEEGAGNSLVISNGGAVVDEEGTMGINTYSSNNTVLVTGPGSVWNSSSYLYIGDGGASNTLTIANAGAVLASAVTIGYSGVIGLSSNNLIRINGGSLTVTDDGYGVLLLGNGGGGVAALILSNGMVTVDQLVLTNGPNSVFTFSAGTLTSGGTFVTNNQLFVVGDGTDAATFQLNGGVHNFANGLEIRTNAALTGCGTINGNVVVDPGGTVLANCGGNLNFTGTVTNNGTVTASNGTMLNFYGLVVNNGVVNATNGGAHLYGGIVNTGTVLPPRERTVGPAATANGRPPPTGRERPRPPSPIWPTSSATRATIPSPSTPPRRAIS